jgi:hypothetical protein
VKIKSFNEKAQEKQQKYQYKQENIWRKAKSGVVAKADGGGGIGIRLATDEIIRRK